MKNQACLRVGAPIVGLSRKWREDEVLSRINSLEKLLRREEVTAGVRVGVAVSDAALFAASVVAIRAVGGVAVLLSSRDSGATRDSSRVAECLDDSDCQLVLVDRRHAEGLAPILSRSDSAQFCLDEEGSLPRLKDLSVGYSDKRCPVNTAIIAYTSGTEGTAKGVMISEESLAWMLEKNILVNEWTKKDRYLSALPLTHLSGFMNFFGALTGAATPVICPDFMWTGKVIETCKTNEITVAPLVPYYLSLLLGTGKFGSLGSLRLVVLSTAPIVPGDVKRASALLPHLRLCNAYGLTEALRSTVLRPEEVLENLPSIGRPVPGIELQLRDESGAESTKRGVAWIKGPNVMVGYWDRYEETAQALKEGWFCTNDLMNRSPNGNYFIEGRLKEVINGGGEKISPESLERVIRSECDVIDVVVVGQSLAGSSFDEVVAVVVPRSNQDLKLEEIRAACATHVHSAFLPSRLILVKSVPRNATGKVDRIAARRLMVADVKAA